MYRAKYFSVYCLLKLKSDCLIYFISIAISDNIVSFKRSILRCWKQYIVHVYVMSSYNMMFERKLILYYLLSTFTSQTEVVIKTKRPNDVNSGVRMARSSDLYVPTMNSRIKLFVENTSYLVWYNCWNFQSIHRPNKTKSLMSSLFSFKKDNHRYLFFSTKLVAAAYM